MTVDNLVQLLPAAVASEEVPDSTMTFCNICNITTKQSFFEAFKKKKKHASKTLKCLIAYCIFDKAKIVKAIR